MLNRSPGVPEYIKFDLDQIPPEITKSTDLASYIRLQTQGGWVDLNESPKTALSMFVFYIIHTVCPGLVLTTKDGQKYLIYNHDPDPVIQAFGINEAISIKNDFNVETETKDDCFIDLKEIWDSINESESTNRIVKSIEIVKTKIRRTQNTTLIGKVPLALIICSQHLVGYNTQRLFYKLHSNSEPKRIK